MTRRGMDAVDPGHLDGRRVPLSAAQRAVWLHEQLAAGTLGNHIAIGIELVGKFEPDVFVEAVMQTYRAHPALRMAIRTDADGPYGFELSEPNPDVSIVDATGWSRAEVDAHWIEHCSVPLDLAAGNGFRFQVIRCRDDLHVVLVVMHHLVADGWTAAILNEAVFARYVAIVEGTAPKRTRIIDPVTLVESQQAKLEAEQDSLAAFWRDELGEGPNPLELPLDRPRTATPSNLGGVVSRVLDPDVRHRLEAIALTNEATMHDVVLAGYAGALSLTSGQDDFVIGVPRSGRGLKNIRQIGNFVNPVPLVTQLDAETTFSGLLGAVHERYERIAAHDAYPFDHITRDHPGTSDGSAHPFLRAVYVWQKAPASLTASRAMAGQMVQISGITDDIGPVEIRSRQWPTTIVNQEIRLLAGEVDGELHLTIDYAKDLFDHASVELMMDRLHDLLQRVSEAPSTPMRTLGVAHGVEVDGPTQPIDDVRLEELFAAQVADRPDAPAVRDADRRLTYAELDAAAEAMARRLAARVQPGRTVGVFVDRSVDMVAALLAVAKAGCAYVPLDPSLPEARLRFMVEDAEVSLVITDQVDGGQLGDSVDLLVIGEAESVVDGSAEIEPEARSNRDLLYIMYTSGSTGVPKGVRITHRNLVNLLQGIHRVVPLDGDDVWLAVTTLSFDISGLELFLPLIRGAEIVIAPTETTVDPRALAELIDRAEPTVMQATPSGWGLLVAAGWSGAPSMRVLCGGEPLPQDLADELRRRVAEVWNVYGPTETTIWSSISRIGDGPVTIGRPVDNTTMAVVDDAGQNLPVGVVGELVIGGAGVADGYHRRPELTSDRFVEDEAGVRRYRTGDLAKIRPDGEFVCLGRIDDQVKIRGHRIELGEVEGALRSLDGISQAAAVRVEDRAGIAALHAFVVPEPDVDLEPMALRSQLRVLLPEYATPTAIGVLDVIPTTPNGKLDRRALGAVDPSAAGKDDRPPATPTEHRLVEIWQDVLEVRSLSATSNFFDLGGHSLLATRIANQVVTEFNVDLPVRAIVDNPTVAELAAAIEDARPSTGDRPRITPVERADRHRLSHTQEQTWLLQHLDPDSPLHNISLALELTGPFDEASFDAALQDAATAHEALRTVIGDDHGVPFQSVLADVVIPLERQDWTEHPHPRAAAERAMQERAAEPMALGPAPLLEVTIHRLGHEHHLVFFLIHHIVADNWSLSVLGHTIFDSYRARIAGEPVDIGPAPLQPIDHASWQRQLVESGALDDQALYWERVLTDLPTLSLRPDPLPGTAGGRQAVARTIPEPFANEVLTAAKQSRTTPFTIYLSAFLALLHRYTNDDDIAVGIFTSGRTTVEAETIVGNLRDTVVVRSDLRGDIPFDDLVGAIDANVATSLANSEIPFVPIPAGTARSRTFGAAPFEVFFNLLTDAYLTPVVPGLLIEPQPVEQNAANTPLALTVDQSRGLIRLEYDAGKFSGVRMERMLDHLLRLLTAATADPGRPVADLEMLDEADHAELADLWGTAETPFADRALLHDLVAKQAEVHPGRVALQTGHGEQITYQELNDRASRLANQLLQIGVRVGDVVGVALGPGIDGSIAMLGINRAGAAFVQIDIDQPMPRINFVLEDARVRVVVTGSKLADHPEWAYDGDVLVVDEGVGVDPEVSTSDPSVEMSSRDLSWIMYTSGSSGTPKAVAIEHRGAVNLFEAMAPALAIGPDSVVASATAVSFDPSIQDFYMTAIVGGRSVILDPLTVSDGRRLAAALDDHGCTSLFATPIIWQQLLAAGWAGRPDFVVQSGGEPLSRDLADRLLPITGAVFNLYGLTETTIWSSAHRVEPGPDSIPVGRPIQNTAFYVLDQDGRPVPAGVVGELAIGGVGVGRHYIGRPELTEERFRPDPFSRADDALMYMTGDLARHNPDGTLQLLGRRDNQVKIRGQRIELGEVEAALSALPEVRLGAVTVAPDLHGGNRLVAYYVPEDRSDVSDDLIRRGLVARLPLALVPTTYVAMEAMPTTASGKIARSALPPPPDAVAPRARSVAPRTDLERSLVEIWSEVLECEPPSVEASFFDLGGHSLLAARIVSRVRERLGIDLPIRRVFEAPSIAELAETTGTSSQVALPELSRTEPRRDYPLTHAQERMWFLHHHADNAAYNVALAARLTGPLVRSTLVEAVNDVVRRHQTLRTRFVLRDGTPVQEIVDDLALEPEIVDWRGVDGGEAQAYEAMRQAAEQPFDLGQLPLLRIELHVLDDESHVAFVNAHHIVADQWALGVFGQEVLEAYRRRLDGCADGLEPLEIEYSDYTVWEKSLVDQPIWNAQLDFWDKQLANTPELPLPTDRPRPPVLSGRTGTVDQPIAAEYLETLDAQCKALQTSPFVVLLSVYIAWLRAASGSDDIAVVTPVANRRSLATERMVANFVGGVVIRVDLAGITSFVDLVHEVENQTLRAFENQDVPIEEAIRRCLAAEGGDRGRFFRAYLNVQVAPFSLGSIPGVSIDIEPIRREAAQSEFALLINPNDRAGGARLEYSQDLYDAPRMEQMLHDYWQLLATVAAEPTRPLASLTIGSSPIAPGAQDALDVVPPELASHQTVQPWEAPQSDLERQIAGVWSDVLDIEQPSRHANFFDLGGHSLLAIRLFGEMSRRLGIDLPMAALFEGPTIAQLAALISGSAETERWTSLVPVRPEGGRLPIFYVSPYLITALSFAGLGDSLTVDRPFYVLQPQGMDTDDEIHGTVQEMASHYLTEIRHVQATGPYLIGGHCAGGLVAFEMARQLEAEGESCRLVVVDAAPPVPDASGRRSVRDLFGRLRYYATGRRLIGAFRWQLAVLVELGVGRFIGGRRRRRMAALRSQHSLAHAAYTPGHYSGDLITIISDEWDRFGHAELMQRWTELLDGGVDVRVVPGTHAELVDLESAAHLAVVLDDSFQESEADVDPANA